MHIGTVQLHHQTFIVLVGHTSYYKFLDNKSQTNLHRQIDIYKHYIFPHVGLLALPVYCLVQRKERYV